ncbi:cytidine deaminase-like protein [Corynascus novoguineensis]|uniref:Cytidine deaminase n=1 Tax=Corynascus novoguineensis TaxID=1126955 RepID=A0AAN7CU78_9PEZI|nr:cytidine deaminase-like protein [Corynascus novoguineensis]
MPTPSPSPITSSEAIDAVCTAHGLSVAEFHALRARATEAKTRAYCPYSNFRVGAALLARAGEGEGESGGRYVLGANVENASYPVTTCAERVALGTAVVEGLHSGNGRGFRAIAVSTDAEGPASPCGMCRQFIREFCELSMPILMFDKNDTFIVMTLGELLPLSFGPDNMGVKDPAKP